jgi:hypothetical protein
MGVGHADCRVRRVELPRQWPNIQRQSAENPAAAPADAAELSPPAFDVDSLSGDVGEAGLDPDETPDGSSRLAKVTTRAREIYAERNDVVRERRPLADNRDILLGEIGQLQGVMKDAVAAKARAASQIGQIRKQMRLATDSMRQALENQETSLQRVISDADMVLRTNQSAITARQPALNALNTAIAPLDSRLTKLWRCRARRLFDRRQFSLDLLWRELARGKSAIDIGSKTCEMRIAGHASSPRAM